MLKTTTAIGVICLTSIVAAVASQGSSDVAHVASSPAPSTPQTAVDKVIPAPLDQPDSKPTSLSQEPKTATALVANTKAVSDDQSSKKPMADKAVDRSDAIQAVPAVPAEKLYGAKTFRLANGLEVYVIENHRTPIVGVFVGYRVGGADDPLGKSGLAHYLEHMMFKGPEGSSSAQIMSFVEQVGGMSNAMTGDDSTIYYEVVPTEHLDKILTMEADRMANLVVLDEQAKPEVQVILEERNMRIGNDPAGAFYSQVESIFFANHPYRIPVIGWVDEIKSFTPSDVRDFHNRAYAPNNAILVLSGDITLAEAQRLVEKTFGPLKMVDLAPRFRPQEPPFIVAKKVTMGSELVDTATLVFRFPAPNFKTAGIARSFALDVLADVLAGSNNSILYTELVENQKIASDVAVNYRGETIDPHSLTMTFGVMPGQDPQVLEGRVKIILKEIIDKGIPRELVEKSKKRMLAKFQLRRDEPLLGADDLCSFLLNGIPLEQLENIPTSLAEVTVDEVNQGIRSVLDTQNYLTAYLVPKNNKPLPAGAGKPITMPGPIK